MELLRRELPKYGGTFVQCEDEIASISMAIGASYAGRVAVTGSSGPGISLKTEALGWAVMAEMPLVIVDVQRGGPSTGMPTNVEQSDLNIACFGGHGDAPRVVIAPANVEDCFYTAIEAVNIARKYSVPVIHPDATRPSPRASRRFRSRTWKKSARTSRPTSRRWPTTSLTICPRRTASRRTSRPARGSLSGKYPIATGLEHDELGHPTGSPKLHMQMTAKRRKKLQALAADAAGCRKFTARPKATSCWSAGVRPQGPIREAVDRARAAGDSVSVAAPPAHQSAAARAWKTFSPASTTSSWWR